MYKMVITNNNIDFNKSSSHFKLIINKGITNTFSIIIRRIT